VSSITELSDSVYGCGYRDGWEDAAREISGGDDQARVLLLIAVVDSYIARSKTLEDFECKWTAAKGLYVEMQANA
jgi:hypothetical protein